ncbi:MAG: peptidase M15 [Sulfuricurvum sp. PD_MW2]|uniref:M15 family metallopeptidase n=1 Tax=Sulfuricurvum sp. PD_MW2 TaxID=2027917 RepID=UPI000C05DE95|nr:M15 family metallopeptidase [Sulfuricurvum sp. PD_MW2]PHM18038.1 MAG: peptidase M15 [Sulfuricurvum sp. PD_MW2]
MITSRKLEDLHPTVREKALKMEKRCEAELGIDLVFTATYRDDESQDALYAIGRTVKGAKVTNAKAGYSYHNFRLAFDVVAVRHGKPVWNTSGEDGKLWQDIGRIGKECGLEWGGDFKTLKDLPHFQDSKGLTLAQLRNGEMVA